MARHQGVIDQSLARVTASGWLVLGPEVRQFEHDFAAYIGAPYCVGVASGSDAIELALRALGVGPGQQVATVANAGMYVSLAILAIGAVPCFMDVCRDTHLTGLAEVRRAVDQGACAVAVTHLYGQALPDIARIARFCAERGVALLEDCAQAHGARVDGRRAGSFGDAACFSFYPTKNLGALGDGGAVVSASAAVADTVACLRQYGWRAKYRVELAGGRNSRLDEMQAALLSALLPTLDRDNAGRRAIARQYGAAIDHPQVQTPTLPADPESHVAHLYVVRSSARDALRAHLHAQGVGAEIHYPLPDHRQALFGARFAAVTLPHTEQLAGEILTLPCYPELSSAQVARVVDAVNQWPGA